MSRTAQQILEDARSLPPGEFNWLIEELLQVGDGASEAEVEASWKAEVERRVAAPEVSTCSWEEAETPPLRFTSQLPATSADKGL